MSSAETAKKLEVNLIAYIHDRTSGDMQIPALAKIISQYAKELQLGVSWETL